MIIHQKLDQSKDFLYAVKPGYNVREGTGSQERYKRESVIGGKALQAGKLYRWESVLRGKAFYAGKRFTREIVLRGKSFYAGQFFTRESVLRGKAFYAGKRYTGEMSFGHKGKGNYKNSDF